MDEFVLKGNAASLKCNIPSFVADYVQVVEWLADDGTVYPAPKGYDDYDFGTVA